MTRAPRSLMRQSSQGHDAELAMGAAVVLREVADGPRGEMLVAFGRAVPSAVGHAEHDVAAARSGSTAQPKSVGGPHQ
jgi:hypothetical protein